MKYYIIAGEASGDLHGGNLIRSIRAKDPQAIIRCWGGEQMQHAGGEVVKHYRDLAFMGFVEVVKNLPAIFRNIRWCKKDIANFQPDVVVLIDYPGFNLIIAPWAKKKGFKVAYYISPQVWAWKEGRVKKMKTCIDQMMVILPFEKDYYQNKWNWNVSYVGHPLVEVINKALAQSPAKPLSDKPIIALLPGSREQEINKKLPIMLEVSKQFPTYQFIVAKAPGTSESFYQEALDQYPEVKWVEGQTYELLKQASAALVTSGTATLETALFGVPQVVCYKGSFLSYEIGKRLISIKYISLVNLIMDKPVVKELIQHELTKENLYTELKKILPGQEEHTRIKKEYQELFDLLSASQNASQKAAEIIINLKDK
jgi:lipid-A-disaccharide synthase